MSPTPDQARFLRACRRQPVDRVPVWFMRQAGRYMEEYRRLRQRHSILEIAKTPELACEVTLQPVRSFPVDAAIIFADILLPAEAMGAKLRFAPGPIIDNPIRSSADVRRIKRVDVEKSLGFVLKAISLTRQSLGGLPLIGFAGAPFTLASYLIEGGPTHDFIRTKALMHGQPKTWDLLLGHVARVTADYLKAQIAWGAQAVQLFDSWVGALSPAEYRRYVMPHSQAVLEALKGSGVPVIHFGTGTAGFLEDFARAGGDVIGIDWRIDLASAWKRVGAKAIQGNLDPTLLLAPTPLLRRAVHELLEQAAHRKGYIFNLGHGILPNTPPGSVKAVADWVHAWSVN
ncbi:MAG: uroporphyrinogen decarboxylase [Elusimicrobia bacterium]|nr:uroporphyrinogen decarboxylase [Elusimicrobiota bacterium]